ncbi:MAG: MBL fold metallo-hydrolase [Pseudomonadota bacterium]
MLPVADPWYETQQLAPRIWCVTEPHVHPIFAANIFLVTGEDRDLVIDSGMGVAPLRPVIDGLRDPAKPLVLLSTHTHVDHIGAAHEFEERWVHPIEAEGLRTPDPWTLNAADIGPHLVALFEEVGFPPLWDLLIDAVPHVGYRPEGYRLTPAPATRLVEDGDDVELGGWTGQILHLPGHSPGQVGLWHGESGTLFGADAVYDGPLLWAAPDVEAYAETLRRLAALPVQTVYGGHDGAFGPARLNQMVAHYLELWGV